MVLGKDPLILDRTEAYIGVLIDDLITRGTNEPYRMFTSRAEYRLLLREDNADLRLREKGYRVGLVEKTDYEKVKAKESHIKAELDRLSSIRISPGEKINKKLVSLGSSPINHMVSLRELLRRPEISYQDLGPFDEEVSKIEDGEAQQVEIQVMYNGYIKRQLQQVKNFKKMEKLKIPLDFDYEAIGGLSTEVKEKLSKIRPHSLSQASRISGVTPAAISVLMIYLKKLGQM